MNRQSRIDIALQEVVDALGVDLVREYMPYGHEYELKLRLADIPEPYGFILRICDDYLIWRLDLNLDIFSAPLVTTMQKRFKERKEGLEPLINLAKIKNNFFKLEINENSNLNSIEGDWNEINFSLARSYYSLDSEFTSLSSAILDFMCIVLFLIIEETEWIGTGDLGHEEGAKYSQIVTKYERSRYNRAVCLKYYGFMCRGCGDKLEEKYGPIGGNVIHVHHITPLSKMGASYILNPIKDLLPLCPNCHNIVHRVDPPMEIKELNTLTNFQELESNF